jgi:hypothetical protein
MFSISIFFFQEQPRIQLENCRAVIQPGFSRLVPQYFFECQSIAQALIFKTVVSDIKEITAYLIHDLSTAEASASLSVFHFVSCLPFISAFKFVTLSLSNKTHGLIS